MKMNEWIRILASFVLCLGFIFLFWTGDNFGVRLIGLLGLIWFGNIAYDGLFFGGKEQ